MKTPSIEEVASVVIWEVGKHFNMDMQSWWYRIFQKMLMLPARKFARVMVDFDQRVAEGSLWQAARDVLPRFTDGWELQKSKMIPRSGPLLVIANHPGAADSIAAMAAIDRPDVHFLVMQRPMLTIMPNFSRHMLYLDEHNPARVDIMRGMINILRDAETLLMFPRGNLEPDPALYHGALDSLTHWSQSLGVILSRVPDTLVQLLLVKRVLLTKAWRSWIARIGKTVKTRHQIAMILQGALQQFFKSWKQPVEVVLPPPVSVRALSRNLDPRAVNLAIRAYVQDEMRRHFKHL